MGSQATGWPDARSSRALGTGEGAGVDTFPHLCESISVCLITE